MAPKELRAIRSRMGLTQAEFAERVRVSRNSIARMEMEKGGQVITPAMELLIQLVTREIGVESPHAKRSGGNAQGKRAHAKAAKTPKG